jgi:hypothetical protein
MRRRLVAGAAAGAVAALGAAGCGGSAGDLLSLRVSGGFAGTAHTIVVSGDGRGSCDKGDLKELPSERVIEAREIERTTRKQARDAADFPSRVADGRQYVLTSKEGTVRWGEGAAGLPKALSRAQLLALRLERALCS